MSYSVVVTKALGSEDGRDPGLGGSPVWTKLHTIHQEILSQKLRLTAMEKDT